MKHYIVTFDRKKNKSYRDFHEDFTSSDIIKGWFHYIKSSYIVATYKSTDEISKHFTDCANLNNVSSTHLVMEVNMSNRQGMLVKDAWKWIKDNAKG